MRIIIGNGTDYNGMKEFHVSITSNLITREPETLDMQIQNNKMVEEDGGGGFITKNPGNHFILLKFPNPFEKASFASIATKPIVYGSTEGNYGTST
ncbi:unnamed protein product [Cercopithifilaria johnstoni]|uniref:Uncharacterized protein n=1 Tax=Cercopithifilaria johnstoni TaxID=2874296 RepID=A0A8J2MCC6_9BILA|nr:unnamed protein product [Cercopithifilaria johnstoni]